MKVSLDQHFMTDPRMLDRIARAAELTPKNRVLEIGAGTGNLTRALAQAGAKVTAVEIDHELASVLKERFSGSRNVEIIEGNALKLIRKTKFNKIVANIPYAICEPLMQALRVIDFELAILTIPEGFYERLRSDSRLGLESRIFFEIREMFKVPKAAFSPQPDTESVMVSIRPKKSVLRQVLLQPNRLVKNAIMEALVEAKKCTKNQAREAIKGMELSNIIGEKRVADMDLNDLRQLISKLK
ncbi:MAG: methyltransferase domain-containing protein [Candidatus Aenigmarchaeota archaeon]|nr:methyltransferase domain-containing protein [Candidatus Aenigmarchaeota archaeon]